MIYIKTGFDAMDNILKKSLADNVTEDIAKADTVVMSALSEEDIDNIERLNKNVFLMTNFDLIEYGKKKGFHTYSPGACIPNVVNEIKAFLEGRPAETIQQKTEDEYYITLKDEENETPQGSYPIPSEKIGSLEELKQQIEQLKRGNRRLKSENIELKEKIKKYQEMILHNKDIKINIK
jgi:hypothetical protein